MLKYYALFVKRAEYFNEHNTFAFVITHILTTSHMVISLIMPSCSVHSNLLPIGTRHSLDAIRPSKLWSSSSSLPIHDHQLVRTTCPAYCHFRFVLCRATSMTLVGCRIHWLVFRSLIRLSLARRVFDSFSKLTTVIVHVSAPNIIIGSMVWSNTCLLKCRGI